MLYFNNQNLMRSLSIFLTMLNLLAKKKKCVVVKVYTFPKTNLIQTDIKNFNAQYPKLEVKMTNAFRDRFMVLDDKTVYHIGASIKDAGKKCFGITLIQDDTIANDLISRFQK